MAKITDSPDRSPGLPDPTPGYRAGYLVRRSEFADQIEVLERSGVGIR